jgi:hypothetical protein
MGPIPLKEALVEKARANPRLSSETNATSGTEVQPVSRVMHWWFLVDTILVLIAGIQLFVLSEFTQYFFAWTIQSPLTAAVLGAAYWGALPFVFYAWRARMWAHARIAVFGVMIFTALSFILTLVHFSRFHLNSPNWTAQVAFWAWLVVYGLVPPGLLVGWLLQRREPGQDPPRSEPLPGWFRGVLVAQAAIMLGVGIALYLAPGAVIAVWPWALTPLTAGALGAWSIGIGLTVAHSVWENDWRRVHGAALAVVALGALELIALGRYAGEVDWGRASAWLVALFMASLLAIGLVGMYVRNRAGATVT